MIKILMLSTALVIGATSFVTAGTESVVTTKTIRAHHEPIMMRRKMKKKPMMSSTMTKNRQVDYGVGPSGGNGRSTATGGNAGGYTNRN